MTHFSFGVHIKCSQLRGALFGTFFCSYYETKVVSQVGCFAVKLNFTPCWLHPWHLSKGVPWGVLDFVLSGTATEVVICLHFVVCFFLCCSICHLAHSRLLFKTEWYSWLRGYSLMSGRSAPSTQVPCTIRLVFFWKKKKWLCSHKGKKNLRVSNHRFPCWVRCVKITHLFQMCRKCTECKYT